MWGEVWGGGTASGGRHISTGPAPPLLLLSFARCPAGRPGRRPVSSPRAPLAPRAARPSPLIFPYLLFCGGSGGHEWPGASLDTIRRRIAQHNSSERWWEVGICRVIYIIICGAVESPINMNIGFVVQQCKSPSRRLGVSAFNKNLRLCAFYTFLSSDSYARVPSSAHPVY